MLTPLALSEAHPGHGEDMQQGLVVDGKLTITPIRSSNERARKAV
jgi:hypothetical protein